MLVTGKLVKILDKQTGTSKAGKEWVKQTFVIDTNEQYNNIIAFELFGEEKVSKFNEYNKVGSVIEVEFNISCREWVNPQGKTSYFTGLQAWKITKGALPSTGDFESIEQVAEAVGGNFEKATQVTNVDDDLPF